MKRLTQREPELKVFNMHRERRDRATTHNKAWESRRQMQQTCGVEHSWSEKTSAQVTTKRGNNKFAALREENAAAGSTLPSPPRESLHKVTRISVIQVPLHPQTTLARPN